MAAVAAPDVHAQAMKSRWKKRRKGLPNEYRVRVGGSFGSMYYQTVSQATNARNSFYADNYGGLLDIDLWFEQGFGLLVNSEILYAGVYSKPLYMGKASASLAWRLFGKGGGMESETVLAVGPAVLSFPEVRPYPGSLRFDLLTPRVLGVRGGLYWRMKVDPEWTIQLGGYGVLPVRMFNAPGELSLTGTQAYGGVMFLDYRIYDGFSLGFGFTYEVNRISYYATGNPEGKNQEVDFNNIAPSLSVLFWF